MNPQRQTVCLIDDHPLFRKGLIQLLQTISDFEVVGEASNGKDGIALVHAVKPDLLLLDLNMKDMSGLDVLKKLKSEDLDTRVVMITVSDQTEDLVAALRLGADGYLLKDMEPEQMIDSLASAAAGRIVVSENLTHMLAAALREQRQPHSAQEAGLTEQERRIVELIAAGMSNKVIGRELGIAEGTVKVHVKHLLRKLDLRSRVEAAVWAVEHLHKAA
ncbi:MAG: two-component system response regulator NarL [Gallionellaceae bacterium]|nr:two-component system response regulator NarL [Gallionellaceae bacterium]MDD5363915.1 two-component system response regulator NarL [Gallionellaceae bacterium]